MEFSIEPEGICTSDSDKLLQKFTCYTDSGFNFRDQNLATDFNPIYPVVFTVVANQN